MFSRAALVLFAIIGLNSDLCAEPPVMLEFSIGAPVEMIVVQSFSIDQIIPGLNFQGNGTQKITSLLTFRSVNTETKITKPPFLLEWTLKVIHIDLLANDSKFEFDSSQPQNSLISKELARWIDRPIQLTVNRELAIERNSEELERFVKKYSAIQELNPYTFLEGLILPIFGLADQELTKGASITRTNMKGDFGLALTSLKYEITEITDRLVNAQFKGNFEPRVLPLSKLFGKESAGSELVEVNVLGEIEGTITWDRSNAALCQMTSNNTYRSKVKLLGIEWPLSVKVKSSLQTTPAAVLVTAPK